MSDGDRGTLRKNTPWSCTCYVLATIELCGAEVNKTSSKEQAMHCMTRAVRVVQEEGSKKKQHQLSLDETLGNIPNTVTAEDAGSCDSPPQDDGTGQKPSTPDGIISAIKGHGYRVGTLTVGDSIVSVTDNNCVVWELEFRRVRAVAALGDDGLVVLGGRPDTPRAVALRLKTNADVKAFVAAFQTTRKNKPAQTRGKTEPEALSPVPPTELTPKSLEPQQIETVSTENSTRPLKLGRPSSLELPAQNPLSLPEESISSFPKYSPEELQTPTSPPPEIPSTLPRKIEGPLISTSHVTEKRESQTSQPSTEPLTPTSPSPRPPVQRSFSSQLSMEPLPPTSPPPRPPVERLDLSCKLSVGNTGENIMTDPEQMNVILASSSTKHKDLLPSSRVLIMPSTEEDTLHNCGQSQNSILNGNRSHSSVSSQPGIQFEMNEDKLDRKTVPCVNGLRKTILKPAVSEKFKIHSKQFIEDELAYCDTLKDLIALRDDINDDCLSMCLTLLAEIRNTHLQIVNFLLSSEQRPNDFAQAFLDHQEELTSYVDLIRASTVLDTENFEDPKGHIRRIVGKMQSIRMKPHHFSLALESWLDFVEPDDKGNLEEAIRSLKTICKDADSFLLVDAVKKCPYNLRFHFPLLRYGEYLVTGKGFQNQQKYTVILMKDLIVFTTRPGTNSFDCVDALRLEHVLIQDSRDADTFIVDVNYGERRGRESIVVKCPTNSEAFNWRREIISMRLDYANKIISTQKNDLAIRAKSLIFARDKVADGPAGNVGFRDTLGIPNQREVALPQNKSQFYVGAGS